MKSQPNERSAVRKRDSAIDYGIDAPGIMVSLLLGGGSVLGLGVALALWSRVLWLFWAGVAVAAVASLPLILGIAMLLYGLVGKTRTRDFLLRQVPWTGKEKVLDIGTGAGLMAIGAAKLLTTGHVFGIDIWSIKDLSNNSIGSVERNIQLEGLAKQVTIQTGDARQLAFETGCFDRVLSLLCLHNIEQKEDQAIACEEIVRVLKPGGYAVIGDYVPVDSYADILQEKGLEIVQKRSAFGTAFALMFYLVAEKPQIG